MKTLFTLVCVLSTSLLCAQDKIFVHTASASNISGHITYIDHPDLNDNPSACISYVHNWNPNGGSGIYNNNVDGLYYEGTIGQWSIFNEDFTEVVPGASYNVFIADDSRCIDHVSTPANTTGHITNIDDPGFNGSDPGPFSIMNNYWNPNGVYNPQNYGTYFNPGADKRAIYEENFNPIPEGAAFKVMIASTVSASSFEHTSSAANITNNYTEIDNALLNNNPEAVFLFQHYWGVDGASTEVYLDKNLGVWYDGSRWNIYTEDQSAMPEGVAFDIVVAEQELLNIEGQDILTMAVYPNPAINMINVEVGNTAIVTATLYNILGQEVAHYKGNGTNLQQLDISNQSSGSYILQVTTADASQSFKIIKN